MCAILQENIEAETARTSIYFWQAKSREYYIAKSLSELPNSKSGRQYLQIFSKISISILAGDIAQDIAAERALSNLVINNFIYNFFMSTKIDLLFLYRWV